MKTRFIIIAVMILATSVLITCEKKQATPMPPNPNQIWMHNYMFEPNTINVAVNTTVTWTNEDNFAHTVTSKTQEFNSGQIAGGSSYSYKFTVAGTYPYVCSIHPFMTGTVVVH